MGAKVVLFLLIAKYFGIFLAHSKKKHYLCTKFCEDKLRSAKSKLSALAGTIFAHVFSRKI